MSVDLMELQESARQVLGGETVSVPEDATWAQVAELGWLMVAVPEELGGLGMNAQGPVVLQTELGRKLSGAPYLSGVLAIEAFCGSTHAERESWLERLMGGEFVAAPLADGSLAIEQTDHGFTVRGTATAVQSADKAEQLLVWDVQSRCVALLALNQDGVTVTPRESWDETRRLFDVALDSVALQADAILASGDAAATLARRLATLRDFGLAADAVGAADMLLELTVEYLQTRRQFSRPLAMFQALKHRCADLKALVVGADALLQSHMGQCLDDLGSEQAELLGEGAKLLACDTFRRVAEESLQLHGGIGMADEHPCHLFLKRALLSEHLGRGLRRYENDLAAALLNPAA